MTWKRTSRVGAVLVAAGALGASLLGPAHGNIDDASGRGPKEPAKEPVAVGYGGAVSTVDAEATAAGMRMLRRGGTAADAAIAAAAALGVTEPFSAGIGGGGFFVHYDAATGEVSTLDGRETAPAAATDQLFIDQATGEPLPFQEARVSGLSVGTPGTLQTWQEALDRWGRYPLRFALRPAIRLARGGFVVDETFRAQVEGNADIFADFPASAELFLPDGAPPEVGTKLKNPALAETYGLIAKHGTEVFYSGEIAADIAATVQSPPVDDDADRTVRPGALSVDDLAGYRVIEREPTLVDYRGLQVFGMGPPSSGGSTVGEALNILENVDLSADDEASALHHYLEASALAFADRNRYVGDPDVVDVPLAELLSQGFADERACELDPERAAAKPVAPGSPDGDYAACGEAGTAGTATSPDGSTTHLTTADRWGNVVSYTLTIEQTGGSGIAVPDRGFLLNNELTDFNFAPTQGDAPDPNLPGPGKRPRSSMSPTVVLDDGEPFLALGTPGGATIITTVLQTLLNRLELGMDLPEAVAAPRMSQLNNPATFAEPAVIGSPLAAELEALGHVLSETGEIGAATGIEFLGDGRLQAVAEPERRGGGSADVLFPLNPPSGEP
ncbi:gamma-glutamyltransferase [Phytoactinopolyspora halotolerans]|uniref:Glutathione hydrolase proenzyme n=1 Tax=Phytoactinopolyspora halotolerans TaxID=1981512 RepID=A0A6L9S8I2_9ACTN|nr:gamma-glutamyltransferase [Phytoactinopolyspora halotolerans]NEE00904.1 gamma-glutamyltransferase [Phytoactinopolyspora halotolerans]